MASRVNARSAQLSTLRAIMSPYEPSYATYLKLSIGAFLAFLSLVFVRRRWLSSLSDIPGPFLGSFSVLWQIIHAIKGHTEEETISLHRKYGTTISLNAEPLNCI
jgi:hypothetical protein